MTKASKFLAGKYVTVEMVESMTEAERTTSIDHVTVENIQGAEKLVMYLKGHDAALPLNNTRIEQLILIHGGDDDTDHWRGTAIKLMVDPSVKYQGRKVGGVDIIAAASPS